MAKNTEEKMFHFLLIKYINCGTMLMMFILFNLQVITRPVFTIYILSILLFGGTTTPLINYLYRPEDRFIANKRRTVQHTKPTDELRVLACIYHQDNANSVLSLLESTHRSPQSPICIYALHLIQLAGRSAAVLAPYKRSKTSNVITETDHIVNAFNYFAQKTPGCVTVLPFTGMSPYDTMHNDVCSLALDKKAAIVLVPFHKHLAIDGTIESFNPAIQNVNINVLAYCPCSVGILVFSGMMASTTFSGPAAGKAIRRVAVYFFGGPDDREALAYGMRMADDPTIGLTVVRFRLPKEMRDAEGKEEKLDNAFVGEFRLNRVDGSRVVYKEEVVMDGEGTVGIIRAMSSNFSLLIVGRREGKESRLTEGLSAWNEYPELGVVGDLLASTDFGGRVETLVVQQQVRFGRRSGEAESAKVQNKAQIIPADSDEE